MKTHFLIFLLLPLFCLSQTDFEKAEKLFAQQRFSQSRLLFENDLKQHPDHLKTIEYLGDIQSIAQNWNGAIIYYERLKNTKPNEANYYYKYGGALAMIAKDSNKLTALMMVGNIENAFLKTIQLNPRHIEARWALVELYLQLPRLFGGSESKAQKYAAELLKISTVDGYLSKGRIAEYFKRYPSAEQYYKLAIEAGNSKTTYQKLADLYKNKLKQPEKARRTMLEFNEKNKS